MKINNKYGYGPVSSKSQEWNSLDNSYNSGQIVRTGNGTILKFQQEISDANSNKILFEHNLNEPDDTILVKNDGILPGAEGFTPNNNLRSRYPFGRSRMRGRGSIHPKIFKGLEIS